MKRYFLLLLIAVLLAACAPSQDMPPFLVKLTPSDPNIYGQCTGVIVGPRDVIAPRHCLGSARRVVTVTGQEAWVDEWYVSQSHDLVLLTTEQVLWVSEFAQFANPELGVQATLYGYSPYTVNHIARHAFYDGLATYQVRNWPEWDYGVWIMTKGKIYGGDSGAPILQQGKVVGIVSLASERVFQGRIAFAVPVDQIRALMEDAHATQEIVQGAN